jgi:site-specific DNA-cytosine methylase
VAFSTYKARRDWFFVHFVTVEMSISHLDVFSGIGGFCLGLRGLSTPLLYCDINDCGSINVLKRQQRFGGLPIAPIVKDIRTLRRATTDESIQPDMVVAGFPCTGFSAAGKGLGLDDSESKLYHQLIRVVDEFKPMMVFMENSPRILSHLHWSRIMVDFTSRGFDLRWVVLPSYAVGRPQARDRWFCLAIRKGSRRKWDVQPGYVPFKAGDEPPRMIDRYTKSASMRCALLGGSVIPALARYAFLFLLSGFRAPNFAWKHVAIQVVHHKSLLELDGDKVPTCGGFWGGALHRMIQPKFEKPDLKLKFYEPRPSRDVTKKSPKVKEILIFATAKFWKACTKSRLGPNKILTKRGINNLSVQLKFEVGTPKKFRVSGGFPHPYFYEWLMGVPCDWTLEAEVEDVTL